MVKIQNYRGVGFLYFLCHFFNLPNQQARLHHIVIHSELRERKRGVCMCVLCVLKLSVCVCVVMC